MLALCTENNLPFTNPPSGGRINCVNQDKTVWINNVATGNQYVCFRLHKSTVIFGKKSQKYYTKIILQKSELGVYWIIKIGW